MGMDVFGRNPIAGAGVYFRASIWSWHPIHHLIGTLCSDWFTDELIEAMAYNDGQGIEDQETCSMMANVFETWLQGNNGNGHSLPSPDLQVTHEGRFATAKEIADPNVETHSPYRVDREHLTEWISFLRHCGGFQVW